MKPPRLPAALTQAAWLRQTRRTALVHWQRLAPREQRLARLGATVVLLALVWLVLLEPAWQTTTRLRTALPPLRAQAAQLDAVIQEAQELKRQAGSDAAAPAQMQPALQASLAQAGLGAVATATTLSDKQWQVDLEHAPAEAVVLWLQGLPFELRVQATEVALQRPTGENGRPLAGMVSGTVSLGTAQAGQP